MSAKKTSRTQKVRGGWCRSNCWQFVMAVWLPGGTSTLTCAINFVHLINETTCYANERKQRMHANVLTRRLVDTLSSLQYFRFASSVITATMVWKFKNLFIIPLMNFTFSASRHALTTYKPSQYFMRSLTLVVRVTRASDRCHRPAF